MKTIVIGWALSIWTVPQGDFSQHTIKTIERSVPYLSQDTCIRDEDLSLLTGKRTKTNGEGDIELKMCTPVLMNIATDG